MTDAQGEATVEVPKCFQALNIDFRYQLTVIAQFARAAVAEEIRDNRFTIKTDQPHVKVCWQVTGNRRDAYAKASPFRVEQDKPANERALYLAPELFGAGQEKAIQLPRLSGDHMSVEHIQEGETPRINGHELRENR